jgi:hypothetical protein
MASGKKKRRKERESQWKRPKKGSTKENARKGGGGFSHFNLPRGVKEWFPEDEGKYKIDVVPYGVTVKNHPDGNKKGEVWYKLQYLIHRLGKRHYVCPQIHGKPCPVHEAHDKLEKKIKKMKPAEAKEYEETLRELRGQTWIAMNILDPDDSDAIRLMASSWQKFWGGDAGLKKELGEGDDDNEGFWDVEGGKTLVVRFSKEKKNKMQWLQANRIDFEDREDMDESEILSKTVNLDEALSVPSYDELKDAFESGGEEDDEKPSKKKGKKKSSKDDDEEEDDAEDDEGDEDESEDEDDDEEDPDDDDDDDSGDSEDDDEDGDEEEDDEDDDDDDEDEKPRKKGKKSRK